MIGGLFGRERHSRMIASSSRDRNFIIMKGHEYFDNMAVNAAYFPGDNTQGAHHIPSLNGTAKALVAAGYFLLFPAVSQSLQ